MASADMEKGYQQGGSPLCLDHTSINSGPSPHSQAIHDTKEPPQPTNETQYGSVKAAKTQSHGADFLKKFFAILAVSMAVTIIVGLLIAIPVAMIVIGSIHQDNCPAENQIPVFLIVGGSVWMITLCIVALPKACCCPPEETKGEEEMKKQKTCEAVVEIFMVSWFVAGSVWVYRAYGHFDSDPTSGNYCDHTLYWFAFWLITAIYIMLGCLVLGCCIAICVN